MPTCKASKLGEVVSAWSAYTDTVCMTIIADYDYHTPVDRHTRQMFRTINLQIVKRSSLEIAALDGGNCAYLALVGNSSNSAKLLVEISQLNCSVFRSGSWVVLVGQRLDLNWDGIKIGIDSDFNVLLKSDHSHHDLLEVYDLPAAGKEKRINTYGSLEKGKVNVMLGGQWDRRRDLMGTHFR